MTQHVYVRSLIVILCVAALGCADEPPGIDRNVDATSQSIRAAVHSNASVASKLARALAEQPGNLFYSPLSIEAVTGILFAGAAGNTAAQLAMLLDAENDPDALHKGLGALLKDLTQEHAQYTLSIANRLWARPGLEPSQAFVDTMREHYDAPTAVVDFAEDPEAARAAINGWVTEQTSSKIPELLEVDQVTTDTEAAIVNAIYFKADWAKAFDGSLTRRDKFYRADSSEVSVDMMSTPKTRLRTLLDGDARWLELPYRTGDVSFLAYTRESEAKVSVQELQQDLDTVDFDEVVSSLHEEELVVQMPRFSMRSRLDLSSVFMQLGVTDLFDPVLADLSNLGASPGVSINPFVHEAAVWIDEQGTVAVAATAAVGGRLSGPPPARFDHPFLFFIRDNLTGAMLFSGRVADPSAEAAGSR
jgi:serpin B